MSCYCRHLEAVEAHHCHHPELELLRPVKKLHCPRTEVKHLRLRENRRGRLAVKPARWLEGGHFLLAPTYRHNPRRAHQPHQESPCRFH